MKHNSLVAFLLIVTILSGGYVALMLAAGEAGGYLAQGYMLLPALSAVITRLFFDEQKFSDANLRIGRLHYYLRFWLFSVGIVLLWFVGYALLGAGRWDLTGQAFLDRLTQQFAATGQDINDTLPPGMTPQMMLLIFFIGGLTIFNILPGLITGFGEEFGWRGLMFPRMYLITPWASFAVGGLIWVAWHLPLGLLVPQEITPQQYVANLAIQVVGGIAAFTYLAYVYVRSRSVWTAALAHITMNNASAAFSYIFILDNQFLGNLSNALVMVLIVGILYLTGRFRVFQEYFETQGSGQHQTL